MGFSEIWRVDWVTVFFGSVPALKKKIGTLGAWEAQYHSKKLFKVLTLEMITYKALWSQNNSQKVINNSGSFFQSNLIGGPLYGPQIWDIVKRFFVVLGIRLVLALKVFSGWTGNRKCLKNGSEPNYSDNGQMMWYFYFSNTPNQDVKRGFYTQNDALKQILKSDFDFKQ